MDANLAAAQDATPKDPPVDAVRRAIVVGPTKAGKTCLLLSLERAAITGSPEVDGFTVRVVPEDDYDLARRRRVIEYFTAPKEAPAEGTQGPEEWRFRVAGTVPRSFGRSQQTGEVALRVLDTKGGSYFPGPNESTAAFDEAGKHADVIVICVDPSDKEKPQDWSSARLLYQNLSRFLSWQLAAGASPAPAPAQRKWPWLRRAPVYWEGSKQYLAARRVLLLLTKIDAYVGMTDPREAKRLAECLDPITLAHRTIDPEQLTAIYDCLAPGSRFAIGLTSWRGFAAPGSPSTDPRWEQRAISTWQPFGVREALLFMATGEVRPPLALVGEEDLRPILHSSNSDRADMSLARLAPPLCRPGSRI